jgi:hypothetical protein
MNRMFSKFFLFLLLTNSLNIGIHIPDTFAHARPITVAESTFESDASHASPIQKMPMDCDDESCLDHHCHIGHCSFYLQESEVLTLAPLYFMTHHFTDPSSVNPYNHDFGLLKPPQFFS